MDLPALKDKNIIPDTIVLKKTLKDTFEVFQELESTILNETHNLVSQWRYYNDGKLHPLQIDVYDKNQLPDILEIIEYKKEQK